MAAHYYNFCWQAFKGFFTVRIRSLYLSFQFKVFSQIHFSNLLVVGKLLCSACFEEGPFKHQVGTVCNGECLLHIMVSDEYANIFALKTCD